MSPADITQSLEGVELLNKYRLHGIVFQNTFNFVNTSNECSHGIFLLKQLSDKGMPHAQLHTSFPGNCCKSFITCCPCLGPYADLKHKIDAFLDHDVMASLVCT